MTATEHQINDAQPIRIPPYRIPKAWEEQVREEIRTLLELDIVEPCHAGTLGFVHSHCREERWLAQDVRGLQASQYGHKGRSLSDATSSTSWGR